LESELRNIRELEDDADTKKKPTYKQTNKQTATTIQIKTLR